MKVTLTALAVGMEAFPLYSHRSSPKVFTQPQLFACLVLKVFYRTDYRGIEEQLRDIPALRQWIGLGECVGCELRAIKYWHQCREMRLMTIVHDVMIVLLLKEVFERAGLIPKEKASAVAKARLMNTNFSDDMDQAAFCAASSCFFACRRVPWI